MTANNQIQYLSHNNIDKSKWDACLTAAPNGLIYAYSYYLDQMVKEWDALIVNDYETVMPLPRKKKWGFSYLFQPPMTPALGIFGRNISAELVQQFLLAIPATFSLWDLSLNHFNPLASCPYPLYKRNNFILSLNNSYENIQKGYHENTRRNSRKAIKEGCVVQKDISIDKVIAISKKQFPKFTIVGDRLFEQLKKIYAHYNQQSVTYGVLNKNGKLVASCAFLFSNGRACYLLVGNEPESRTYGASSLLIDSFIQDHQKQNLLLDFEGSDEEGIAGFYKKFGATPEPFYTIYYNRLPFPFNLLKKIPQHYRGLAMK
jgi:hypothetical protein